MYSRLPTHEKVLIWGIISLAIGVVVWKVRTHQSPATGGQITDQKTGAPASAPAEEPTAEAVSGGTEQEQVTAPQTTEVFVKVSKSLLWHQNRYQKGWAGEIEAALQRALLHKSSASAVKPIVLLTEKQGAATLEVDALISLDGGKAEARLTARLQRGGQLLAALEGVTEARVAHAPAIKPESPESLDQAAFLRRLISLAAEDLSRQTLKALEAAPLPAEKVGEEKPAEGTAAPPPKPSRSRGWLWGLLVGIAVGIAVGPTVQRWMASRRRPAAKEED